MGLHLESGTSVALLEGGGEVLLENEYVGAGGSTGAGAAVAASWRTIAPSGGLTGGGGAAPHLFAHLVGEGGASISSTAVVLLNFLPAGGSGCGGTAEPEYEQVYYPAFDDPDCLALARTGSEVRVEVAGGLLAAVTACTIKPAVLARRRREYAARRIYRPPSR